VNPSERDGAVDAWRKDFLFFFLKPSESVRKRRRGGCMEKRFFSKHTYY